MIIINPIVKQAVKTALKKRRCFGYLFYGDNQKDMNSTPVFTIRRFTASLILNCLILKNYSLTPLFVMSAPFLKMMQSLQRVIL